MIPRARRLLWRLIGPWVGERPLPVGGVARDRHLLRRAFARRPVGRVLVIGPALAARQALPAVKIDVAGTSPHRAEVTVCSAVRGVDSLPARRWDTIVITDPDEDLPARLRAILPACRPAAQLVVVDRGEPADQGARELAIQEVASIEKVLARHGHRAWVASIR